MVELEESRRKLVNLKMQRDAAVGMHAPAPSAVNGNLSPEKTTDRSKPFWELRDSLDETKILAADRLSELENQTLSKELEGEGLEDELKDDKHIHSSHLYSLASATEAEIAELRAKLDASERDVLELKEAIKSKDKEAESIGQAYEDMQTQNQHLLQQVGERDDYNIKIWPQYEVVEKLSCYPRSRHWQSTFNKLMHQWNH
ncbi:hypothetical protein H0E87_005879 [Populus deltoides]|uniref:E3 ubiquitin protein ligase n=1 Tax=Populus deltoides TaxID=3696 RepID=A0A8T2Z4Y9_POPDE|nr:hypothetical protein H0E87_005879 [Populus deltoides]